MDGCCWGIMNVFDEVRTTQWESWISAPPSPTTHDAENEPLINTAPRRQGRPASSQTLAKTITNQEPQLQQQQQPQEKQQQRPQPQQQSQRIINRQQHLQNPGAPWTVFCSASLFIFLGFLHSLHPLALYLFFIRSLFLLITIAWWRTESTVQKFVSVNSHCVVLTSSNTFIKCRTIILLINS